VYFFQKVEKDFGNPENKLKSKLKFFLANTAAAVTGLICFVTFAPFTFLMQNFNNISLPVLLAASLFTNSAMGFGFLVIVRHEGNGNGKPV
jgi:ATP-binding cassette, subfamily A (ABC1), member 3